ncbi:MAG: DUF262 domain-containing protein [Anaerolineae bacterium]|nr:DUF262 domain-containing protein [Anaerolineae bacterium]
MISARVGSIQHLIGYTDRQYIVPTFQRSYAWVDRMWEDLWEDINRYLDPSFRNREHFFGVIVLMPLRDTNRKLQRYLILDGQQRLITVCLLLAALRDSVPKDSENKSQFSDRINTFLFLRSWPLEREPQSKLMLTPSDHESFENILFERETKTKNLLSKAYLYFRQKINESLNTDFELFLAAEVILNNFQLVSILLAPDEDPFPVISSINSRGMMMQEEDLAIVRKFSPDPRLMALIASGESQTQEFKVGACRNPHTGRHDNGMRDNITKAVAAFMNTDGGTLVIGVADDGTIIGIEKEYGIANRGKANWDGYELFLRDMLDNSLSVAAAFQYFKIKRHTLQGHDIAQIQVNPAPEPAFVNGKLYVRAGAQSKELPGPDLIAYVNGRWGN